MKHTINFILILVATLFMNSCNKTEQSTPQTNTQTGTAQQTTLYQCVMKCEGEKTYTQPGKCPVCGMELQVITANNTEEKTIDHKSTVTIVGTMRNVMHKGELFGTITLDTIHNKTHLYGVGPVEYLTGEMLIVEGKSYKSSVASDGSIAMEETDNVKVPFFVYANVNVWRETVLPESIQTIPQLEMYLDLITKNNARPFAFKVTATVDSAEIHIVNLPKGTEVHSPEDAHKNQKIYSLVNERAQLIGFFSTEHQGIFTHHDTYVHIHLITDDMKKMGHLDNVVMKKGTAKLYLPQE